MKLIATLLLASLNVMVSTQASAAPQQVTLSIPGMSCPACPFTVKAALSQVQGVTDIEIDYPAREATVSFDDSRTSVHALSQASAEAGYPASEKPHTAAPQ